MAKNKLDNGKHQIGDIVINNDAMEIAPMHGTKAISNPNPKPDDKPKTDTPKEK